MSEPYLIEVELRRDLVPSFDRYPFNLPAVVSLDRLPVHPAITFFAGERGSGISALLEGIADALGLKATRPSQSTLHEYLTLQRGPDVPRDGLFLRDGQVHGEAYLALVMNQFGGEGLYLVDEPEAALSPMRQMSLVTLLHRLVKAGSQIMITTNSPILLAYPDSVIYQFAPDLVTRVAYEDTEHYTVTKDFLHRHRAMLRILLENDDAGHDRPVSIFDEDIL